MFYPYGFDKNILAYSTTKIIHTGTEYLYFQGNNEAIERDSNGYYTINQLALEKSTLSKTVLSKFFGTSFGLDDICFHNINSTWVVLNYKTDVDIGLTFQFNDRNISVLPTQEKCEQIFASDKFLVILNHGYSTYSQDDVMKYLSVNEKFHQFLNEQHLNMTNIKKGDLLPIFYSEAYVKVSWITYIITGILIFIAWSGFVLLCIEIRNFIK
jgi:RNA recognition motif-containing protein